VAISNSSKKVNSRFFLTIICILGNLNFIMIFFIINITTCKNKKNAWFSSTFWVFFRCYPLDLLLF